MVGPANAGRPRRVGCDDRRLRRGNSDAAALHFRARNVQAGSLGPGGGGRDRSHCCCDCILADIWARRAEYQTQSLTHLRRQQCMPTGREPVWVSRLRWSPPARRYPHDYPRKGHRRRQNRGSGRAAPLRLHGFVTGASIVTPASSASQHSRPSASGGAVGSRMARGASRGIERQRYVTVETCFVTIGWGDGEAIGRRKIVVEGSDRARAGPGLGGVGAADVAGVLAGRSDSRGVDAPGGRVGRVSGRQAADVRGATVRPQQLRCRDRVGVVGARERAVTGGGAGGGRRGRGVLCGHWLPRIPGSIPAPWRPPSCCAG